MYTYRIIREHLLHIVDGWGIILFPQGLICQVSWSVSNCLPGNGGINELA